MLYLSYDTFVVVVVVLVVVQSHLSPKACDIRKQVLKCSPQLIVGVQSHLF